MIEEILNLKTKIQAYIDNIGRKYLKGKAVQMEIINNNKALPVIINNYMLRLLETYKQDAQADHGTILAMLNNTQSRHESIDLNTALYRISLNISTINKAIEAYQHERQELDKDMRSSLGIIPVVIPKINNNSKK